MIKRLLIPDDMVAPGYYLIHWHEIVKKYGDNNLNQNKLKPYREMYYGAVTAGVFTKNTGRPHFVSMPKDEPSDVDIHELIPTSFNDQPSYKLEKTSIQLTRCSMLSGETVYKQVRKKNQKGLEGTVLAVHLEEEKGVSFNDEDLVEWQSKICSLDPLYPEEVSVISALEGGRFAKFLLSEIKDGYLPRQTIVNANDKKAFFIEPSILHSKIGAERTIRPKGRISLELP